MSEFTGFTRKELIRILRARTFKSDMMQTALRRERNAAVVALKSVLSMIESGVATEAQVEIIMEGARGVVNLIDPCPDKRPDMVELLDSMPLYEYGIDGYLKSATTDNQESPSAKIQRFFEALEDDAEVQ